MEDLYSRPEVTAELQTGADKRLQTELERQTTYLFDKNLVAFTPDNSDAVDFLLHRINPKNHTG